MKKSTSTYPHVPRVTNLEVARNEFKIFLEELEMLSSTQTRVNVSSYLLEYKHLFNSFMSVYENEKRLRKKIKKFQEDIIKLSREMNVNLEMSEKEEQHIEVMQLETKRQKDRVHHLSEELKENRLKILQENREIEFVEKRLGLEYEQKFNKFQNSILEATTAKDVVERRKTLLFDHANKLQSRESQLQKMFTKFLKRKEKMQNEVYVFKERYETLISTIGNKNQQMKNNKQFLEERKKESQAKAHEKEMNEKEYQKLRGNLKKLQETERKTQDLFRLKELELSKKVETECEEKSRRARIISNNAKLETEKERMDSKIKETESTLNQIANMNHKLDNRKQYLLEKKSKMLRAKEHTLEKKHKILAEMEEMEEQMKEIKKESEKQRTEIESFNHQKQLLTQNSDKEDLTENTKKTVLSLLANKKRHLIQNIGFHQREMEKNRKGIYLLKDQRKLNKSIVMDIQEKCNSTRVKIDMLNMTNEVLTKKIEEEKKKLKNQQSLFGEVEYNRNELSKKLSKIEMLNKIQNKKFFILMTTIKHVKSEIKKRDQDLREKSFDSFKIKEEIKRLERGRKAFDESIQAIKLKCKQKMNQINTLNKVIQSFQENKNKQKREVELLINERDILGNNLLERNNQIAKLYEEMKLNQKCINNGKLEFDKKCDKLEMLKSRARCLQKKIDEIHEVLKHENDLKNEVYQLRRDLVDEKMKLTVLIDESNICLNIHRFRGLKNTDSDLYNKLFVAQKLEKELYHQSKKLHEIDSLIKEKEVLYKNLRVVLDKKQNSLILDQTSVLEKTLKKKVVHLADTKKKLKEVKLFYKSSLAEEKNLKKEYTSVSSKFKRHYKNKENSM